MPAVGIYAVSGFPTPFLFLCSRIYRLFYSKICFVCYLSFQYIYVEVKFLFKDQSGKNSVEPADLYTTQFYIVW